MFTRIGSGFHLIGDAGRVFAKYPIFMVPLIAIWMVYAPIVLWLRWYEPWEEYRTR